MNIAAIITTIAVCLFGFAGGGGSSSGGGGGGGGGGSYHSSSHSSSSSSSSSSSEDGDWALAVIFSGIMFLIVRSLLSKSSKSSYKDFNSTAAEKDIHQKAAEIFKSYQSDWSDLNATNIKKYTTASYSKHAGLMLELLKDLHRKNKVSRLKLKKVYLLNPVRDDATFPVNVRVAFHFAGLSSQSDKLRGKTEIGKGIQATAGNNAIIDSLYTDNTVAAAGSIAASLSSNAVGATAVVAVKNNEVTAKLAKSDVSANAANDATKNLMGEQVHGVYVGANAKETQFIGGAGVAVSGGSSFNGVVSVLVNNNKVYSDASEAALKSSFVKETKEIKYPFYYENKNQSSLGRQGPVPEDRIENVINLWKMRPDLITLYILVELPGGGKEYRKINNPDERIHTEHGICVRRRRRERQGRRRHPADPHGRRPERLSRQRRGCLRGHLSVQQGCAGSGPRYGGRRQCHRQCQEQG